MTTTTPHVAGGPPRKPLILVVEDHDTARNTPTALLSSTGYDVAETPNGREALALLAQGPRPDLILLDLMMPVMDGWEFMNRQRRDWRLCTIPTIVVTGVASHDPRCLEMPVVRFVPKPYTSDALDGGRRRRNTGAWRRLSSRASAAHHYRFPLV